MHSHVHNMGKLSVSPGPLFFCMHPYISFFPEFLSMFSPEDSPPSTLIPRLFSNSTHNYLTGSHILGISPYLQILPVSSGCCELM